MDPDADVAVLPFHFDLVEHQLRHAFVPGNSVVREDAVPKHYGVGDPCYAVGLFRLLVGTKENLAVVHAGHLGLVPCRRPFRIHRIRESAPFS